MEITRRRILKSLVLGVAIAFPVGRLAIADNRKEPKSIFDLAKMIEKETGRDVFIINPHTEAMFWGISTPEKLQNRQKIRNNELMARIDTSVLHKIK